MKKTDIENESERLKKALNQLKNDNKKFKQQAKYAKDTKKNLKEESLGFSLDQTDLFPKVKKHGMVSATIMQSSYHSKILNSLTQP